jgi:2-polyprenyl-3-methyl-5-hydroxy-6-metoxy-1,4-benzoquinol methylase
VDFLTREIPKMIEETQSNWTCVTELMGDKRPVVLGKYASYWFNKTPRRMLYSLSYYKFAAKLIGNEKRVLDVGCNEGLGTWVIAKECGFARGVDFDEEAIHTAQRNFDDPKIEFLSQDFLQVSPSAVWDAVISFDVIEHIFPENEPRFFEQLTANLKPEGLVVIGTPSLISQQFASEVSKKGHVNIYSPERLEKVMRDYFSFVFIFAANDEVVHTGYLPLAHYLIAVGCKKR